MNTTTIIGRLGQDPDLRYTTNGTPVVTFRLAVPNPRDNDQPDWIPVTALGKVAEAVAEYVSKGHQVAVTGRLTSAEWDDAGGQRHFKLEVTARSIDFLTPANRTDTNGDGAHPIQATA